MKLIVEKSPATGDWWVRCVAGNGRIVGTSQEGVRKRTHAVEMAGALAWRNTGRHQGWRVKVVRAEGGFRWHIVAANGRKVFGSHEVLTKRAHAERMAYRVLTEAHELEVRG